MIRIVNVNSKDKAPYEAEVFARYGAEYECVSTSNAEEGIAAAKDADVILFTAAKFTSEVFDALPKLRLMVRYGMGYDTVDLAAARAHGVDVCNAPSYGAEAVSEHAWAMLMAANRKIPSYDAHIRTGEFGKSAAYRPMRMSGKTLGILGFGRIARRVAQFGKGFSMRILAYDPYLPESVFADAGVEKADLDTLLRESDYISVNAPLTKETYHILNAEAFAKMKPTAVLANTARGALIDEDALVDALEKGVIRAAAVDVYENYPKEPDSPLLVPENLVLTPHVAWDTVESYDALHREVTDEVVRFLEGKPNLNIVNRAK
ncbi:MAG: C-terminal binding protein [Clostridia bacterium]|nr:C-terminal binding protein [Clostridia bacterium]